MTLSPSASATPSWGLPTPQHVIAQVQNFAANIAQIVVNQIAGVQRNLAQLSADLARIFGIHEQVITAPGSYGTPNADAQYWTSSDINTAALATIAMAYAQLTGTVVNLAGFINTAQNTDSQFNNGQKMYEPGNTVWLNDSLELLQDKGVRVISTYYPNGDFSKALNDLAENLQDPGKVMMAVINGPATGLSGTYWKSVVVLGVDTANGTVRLNDPTLADGQDMTMSLDDFQSAWQSKSYRLISAALNATPRTPVVVPPSAPTRLVWSLPRPDQLGSALGGFAVNVTALVVHQIQGIAGNLTDFGNDLANALGIGPQTNTVTGPPAPNETQFGNYAANLPYWIYQGKKASCSLMAIAGVVGQLTGSMPTEEAILNLARSTASDVYADETIFVGDGDGKTGGHYGTNNVDAVKLLNMYGLNADMTQYTKGQGALALDDLEAALSDGQGAMVSIHNTTLYNGYLRKYLGYDLTPLSGIQQSNHNVIVLAVDLDRNTVYLNDSAPKEGQGLAVPLDTFMRAWQASTFTLITAERQTASSAAAGVTSLSAAA
ncbi:hypothetical protein [Mycolicibacterium sp. J2]|uniref:hypothetical protein n=1 Tax=Mycolicibacterium sp. J2 TaxID=2993511 RepID=UPI00224B52F2|nr:hypothetical protein [Mycolicibacterium sp. J2]MCX2712455.1 hypothetical protein [Mycolicibacterium sp. J2]